MSWCKHCVDRSGWFSTNYKCNVSGEEVDIPSSYLENYCKYDYMASKCPFYSQNYSTGGCFITTVTCNILNKADDNEVMNGLRKFRDEVLQKDEKYEEILKNYDVVGPIIATKLYNDENREKIAETIYEHVLTPISKMVKEEKNDEAVEAYYQMTLLFINYYGLKHPYNYIAEHDFGYQEGEFNQKTAGHGKKSKKYIKEQEKTLD